MPAGSLAAEREGSAGKKARGLPRGAHLRGAERRDWSLRRRKLRRQRLCGDGRKQAALVERRLKPKPVEIAMAAADR